MKRITKWISTLIMLLLPLLSQAHEGHSHFQASDIRHYWGSPEHLIPVMILVLILAAILIKIVKLTTKEKAPQEVNDK